MNAIKWAQQVKREREQEQRDHARWAAEQAAEQRRLMPGLAQELCAAIDLNPQRLFVAVDGDDTEIAHWQGRVRVIAKLDRRVEVEVNLPMYKTKNRIAVVTVTKGRSQAGATMHWDKDGMAALKEKVAACILQVC